MNVGVDVWFLKFRTKIEDSERIVDASAYRESVQGEDCEKRDAVSESVSVSILLSLSLLFCSPLVPDIARISSQILPLSGHLSK